MQLAENGVPVGRGGGEGASICPVRSRIRPPAAGLALFGIIPRRSQPLRWCLLDIADHSLQSNVLCFVEDPEFSYKDFTRRGEQAPPTFHAQVGACGPAPAKGEGVAGPACLDGWEQWGLGIAQTAWVQRVKGWDQARAV